MRLQTGAAGTTFYWLTATATQDLQALDAYEAKHGSFAEMVREH